MDYFVSFDVESGGLHGQGFAVGAVAIRSGVEVDTFFGFAPCTIPAVADAEWVNENVMPALPKVVTHDTPYLLRRAWWHWYQQHRTAGAILVADCPWPVEANWLSACVADDPVMRAWHGPYPLIDVASVRLAKGLDPLATEGRLPNELPVHNPLADARQSARLLLEALAR